MLFKVNLFAFALKLIKVLHQPANLQKGSRGKCTTKAFEDGWKRFPMLVVC